MILRQVENSLATISIDKLLGLDHPIGHDGKRTHNESGSWNFAGSQPSATVRVAVSFGWIRKNQACSKQSKMNH